MYDAARRVDPVAAARNVHIDAHEYCTGFSAEVCLDACVALDAELRIGCDSAPLVDASARDEATARGSVVARCSVVILRRNVFMLAS